MPRRQPRNEEILNALREKYIILSSDGKRTMFSYQKAIAVIEQHKGNIYDIVNLTCYSNKNPKGTITAHVMRFIANVLTGKESPPKATDAQRLAAAAQQQQQQTSAASRAAVQANRARPAARQFEYLPRARTGADAILRVLYNNQVQPMSKYQIMAKAAPLSDSSFYEADGRGRTAWDNIKTLERHHLVDREARSRQFAEYGKWGGACDLFSITNAGIEVVEHLLATRDHVAVAGAARPAMSSASFSPSFSPSSSPSSRTGAFSSPFSFASMASLALPHSPSLHSISSLTHSPKVMPAGLCSPTTSCKNKTCKELHEFLTDPAQTTIRLAGYSKERRKHVHGVLEASFPTITHQSEQEGKTLVLRKPQGFRLEQSVSVAGKENLQGGGATAPRCAREMAVARAQERAKAQKLQRLAEEPVHTPSKRRRVQQVEQVEQVDLHDEQLLDLMTEEEQYQYALRLSAASSPPSAASFPAAWPTGAASSSVASSNRVAPAAAAPVHYDEDEALALALSESQAAAAAPVSSPASPAASPAKRPQEKLWVSCVVDHKAERLKNTDPNRIPLRTHEVHAAAQQAREEQAKRNPLLSDFGLTSHRRELFLGDYAWVLVKDSEVERSHDSASADDAALVDSARVLAVLIERKEIKDLVQNSGGRDVPRYLSQLRRLDACGLQHTFLLIEGEQQLARTLTVWDADAGPDAGQISSLTDLYALQIDILRGLHGPRLKVLETGSLEGTLGFLAGLSVLLMRALADGDTSLLGPDWATESNFKAFTAAVRQQARQLRQGGEPTRPTRCQLPGPVTEVGLFGRVEAGAKAVKAAASPGDFSKLQHMTALGPVEVVCSHSLQLLSCPNGNGNGPVFVIYAPGKTLLEIMVTLYLDLGGPVPLRIGDPGAVEALCAVACQLACALEASPFLADQTGPRLLLVENIASALQNEKRKQVEALKQQASGALDASSSNAQARRRSALCDGGGLPQLLQLVELEMQLRHRLRFKHTQNPQQTLLFLAVIETRLNAASCQGSSSSSSSSASSSSSSVPSAPSSSPPSSCSSEPASSSSTSVSSAAQGARSAESPADMPRTESGWRRKVLQLQKEKDALEQQLAKQQQQQQQGKAQGVGREEPCADADVATQEFEDEEEQDEELKRALAASLETCHKAEDVATLELEEDDSEGEEEQSLRAQPRLIRRVSSGLGAAFATQSTTTTSTKAETEEEVIDFTQ
eukprot:g30806.t1